jgi:tricorn protease-like protein
LGGYIPFSGGSNLYKISVVTKDITEIIPQTPLTSPQTCLDAISGDYRFVADHCVQNVITIRDIQNGETTTIQTPADAAGYRLLGRARFSPDSNRVAFALAQGDPSNERGWVAVGDSTGGLAKLILVGEAGSYYTVQGWLDDQTVLVQSNPIMCNGACSSQLFMVGVDGSNPTRVADGSLLTVIDH